MLQLLGNNFYIDRASQLAESNSLGGQKYSSDILRKFCKHTFIQRKVFTLADYVRQWRLEQFVAGGCISAFGAQRVKINQICKMQYELNF